MGYVKIFQVEIGFLHDQISQMKFFKFKFSMLKKFKLKKSKFKK